MNMILLLSTQPWVGRLGWTLVHFLWQGALIFSLYAVARRRLDSWKNAQIRYVLASVTLAVMVTAPVATYTASNSSKLSPADGLAASPPHVPVTDPNSPAVPFESLPSAASPVWREEVMPCVVVAWFAGAITLWMRLVGGLLVATRLRSALIREVPTVWKDALDVLRARVRVSAPVRMLSSALVQVPTVVGWLRPVILLPIGALTGLAPEHIKALLAHEPAHVRRRDYLVNVLQSVAEALLFYHPAVWWVSSHIRAERELCCDDVAVAVGGDAFTYVQALTRLESYRPEHLSASLAANGGSLPDRIARLLGQSRTPLCNMPGTGMLLTGLLLVVTACGLLGQAADARPTFDVASVRPDKSQTGVDRIQSSKGSLIIVNVSLKRLLGMAYGVSEGRDYLFAGPDWLDSERFDISAKFPPETGDSEIALMLQRLLDERFSLKLHREAREFSVYALVVAKGGPKLHSAATQGPYSFRAQAGHAEGTSLSMPQFADRLSRPVFQLGRSIRVVDFTGLMGTFDLMVDWRLDGTQADNEIDDLGRPSIISALPEQLGLKLESRRVPLDVLVVDKAMKVPAEN